MLASFVLFSTLIVNATSVFIYWYYRSHRKNKSFVNRYNLLRGKWCELNRNYYASRAFIKTILTRLASASVSYDLLKEMHVSLTCVLIAIQAIEL